MKPYYVVCLCVMLTSCAAMLPLVTDMLGGAAKGGVSAEVVLGDKEQTLGNNLEIKAKNLNGNVVGKDDNSVGQIEGEVEINNIDMPVWIVLVLAVFAFAIGVLSPRPRMWKRFLAWRKTQ